MSDTPPTEPKRFKLKLADDLSDQGDRSSARIAGWGSNVRQREKAFADPVEVQVNGDPDIWLPALMAVHLLSSTAFKNDDDAKAVILSRVQDGVLQGAADAFLQEADIGNVSFDDIEFRNYRPKQHEGQYQRAAIKYASSDQVRILLPDDYLAARDGWSLDVGQILWREGRFFAHHATIISGRPTATAKNAGRIRRVVADLHFRESDILRVAGQLEAPEPVGTSKARPLVASCQLVQNDELPSWDDGPVIAELKQLIEERTIHTIYGALGSYGLRAKLQRRILTGARGISHATAGRRAGDIIAEWRKAYLTKE